MAKLKKMEKVLIRQKSRLKPKIQIPKDRPKDRPKIQTRKGQLKGRSDTETEILKNGKKHLLVYVVGWTIQKSLLYEQNVQKSLEIPNCKQTQDSS